jgi:hypothetical protein
MDAEQSYFQTAINTIVIHLQGIFNREDVFVYNTYQCYRKVKSHSCSFHPSFLMHDISRIHWMSFKLI